MHIQELLKTMIDTGASDLHVKTGKKPLLRVRGDLQPADMPALDGEGVKELVFQVLTEKQREQFDNRNEFDCSYTWDEVARFRANVFRERGNLTMVMRVIPAVIPDLKELDVPDSYMEIANAAERGLVLITGATGSGKSTTLAAMINEINENDHEHIVTIEDPIEFVHPDKNCSVCQREVGLDTETFASALRFVLRQDPDVILIGEMRDAETVRAAISAAETGHLVFSTLHTLDATQTIDRIVDFFPNDQQQQIRVQLSNSLKAVVSQRLVKRADETGLIPAAEIMVCTPTIRSYITENKLSAIRGLIKEGENDGMMTFDQCLVRLVKSGKITKEVGLSNASSPSEVELAMKGITSSRGSAQNILESMNAQANKQEISQWMNKGVNFMKREMITEAGDAFRKVLRLDANHREAKHYLEILDQRVGNEMMGQEAKVYIKKGLEFYQEDKVAEAVKEWEQALTIDPVNAQAKAYIKGAQERVEALKGAASAIEKGVQAYQRGELEAAIAAWEEALKVDPHNEQAEHYLKEGYKQRERLEKEQEAKQAFVQAGSEMQEGKILQAAAHFQKSLLLNPEFGEAGEYLAEARRMVEEAGLEGVDPAAEGAGAVTVPWKEGIQFFINNEFLNAAKAFNKAKAKRPTLASINELIELAKNLHEEELNACNTKARAAWEAGDMVGAVKIWNQGAFIDPKYAPIQEALAAAKPTVDEQLQGWYQEAVEASKDGKPKVAIVLLERILELDPTNENATKRLAEARENKAKLDSIVSNIQ